MILADSRPLILARNESYKSAWRIKIGAVVTDKRGNIVGVGHNNGKTHPLQRRLNLQYKYYSGRGSAPHNPRLHAETLALLRAGDKAYRGTLYVYREQRNGVLGKSRPCAACRGYMREVGIEKVVYTNELGIQIEYL